MIRLKLDETVVATMYMDFEEDVLNLKDVKVNKNLFIQFIKAAPKTGTALIIIQHL